MKEEEEGKEEEEEKEEEEIDKYKMSLMLAFCRPT